MVRALQGQEETFEMYFRMKPPMFPAATLPFPSAGDVLPRCLSLRPATCCPVAFPFGRRPSVQGAGYVGGPDTQGVARFTRFALGEGPLAPMGRSCQRCLLRPQGQIG